MKSILATYYQYLRHLRKHKRKIAYLQLTGRIEDFLVKEFISFAHTKNIFAITNVGRKNQQKVDICLLEGKIEKPTIFGMIEAKYLRNIHRAWHGNAADEIVPTLKSLKRQLHIFSSTKHGRFGVNLKAHSNSIYGLVFASYVSRARTEVKKKSYYDSILMKAKRDFRYHDLSQPYFRSVYDDVKIEALDAVFYVTLKCGLWKKR